MGRALVDDIFRTKHSSATKIQAAARAHFARATVWFLRTYCNNIRVTELQRIVRGHRGRQVARAKKNCLNWRVKMRENPSVIYDACRAAVGLFLNCRDWRKIKSFRGAHDIADWGSIDPQLASLCVPADVLFSYALFYVQEDPYCQLVVPSEDLGFVTFVRRTLPTRNQPIFLIVTAFEEAGI